MLNLIKKIILFTVSAGMIIYALTYSVKLGQSKNNIHRSAMAVAIDGPTYFTDSGLVGVKFDRAIVERCDVKIRAFLTNEQQNRTVVLNIIDLPAEIAGSIYHLNWVTHQLVRGSDWYLKIFIDSHCGFLDKEAYKIKAMKLKVIVNAVDNT